jgi:D-tyrosyl-tRNA(Tyr) deacylase
MRAVIQRVKKASVTVNEELVGSIGPGLLIFLGVAEGDDGTDVDWLSSKIKGLRIFNDVSGKMNLSVQEIHGAALVVSQFTLHASTKKGNRPSFIQAARPEIAIPLYESFISHMRNKEGMRVETGLFGADMQVTLVNDGPVTIIMDSKNKE